MTTKARHLFFAWALGAGFPAVAGESGEDVLASRLQERVATILGDAGAAGAGLAIVDVGAAPARHWAGGVGLADRAAATAFGPDTVVPVASVSKTFVGLALANLVDQGALSLAEPVLRLLPDLPIVNPWETERPVTVRDLLEHTSGLQEVILPWPTPRHLADVAPGVDRTHLPAATVLSQLVPPVQVRWRPGSVTTYSNYNYIAAAALIERLTGMPFDEHVRATIFAPLGMASSTFRASEVDASRLAKGYASENGAPLLPGESYYRYAAGLWTTPRDLARFLEAVLRGGALDGVRITTPAALALMERPGASAAAREGARLGHGPGVVVRQTQERVVAGHAGAIDGFVSALYYSRELGFGYVVLLNAHLFGAVPPRAQLESAIFDVYLAERKSPRRPAVPPTPELAAFTGFYRLLNPRFALTGFGERLSGVRWVESTARGLEVSTVTGPARTMVPVGDGLLRGEYEVEASLVAGRLADGRRILAAMPEDVYVESSVWVYWHEVGLLLVAALAVVLFVAGSSLSIRAWRHDPGERRAHGWAWLAVLTLIVTPALTLSFASTEVATTLNLRTGAIAAATALAPGLGILSLAQCLRGGKRRWTWRRWIAFAGAAGCAALGLYLAAQGFVAVRLWDFPGL